MQINIYIKPKSLKSEDISLFITAILPDLIDSIGDNFKLSIYKWTYDLNFNVTYDISNEIDPNLDIFYQKNKEFIEEHPLITTHESVFISKHPSRLIKNLVIKNGIYYSI